MATTFTNDYADGKQPMPEPEGGEVVNVRLAYSIGAALVINDIMHVGYLPAGCVVVDSDVDTDDLDTNGTPTILLEAGVLNTGLTDVDDAKSGGASWIGASTIGQTGGLQRATDKAVKRVPVDKVNALPVGIHVSAAPATGATSGEVALNLSYRAAHYDG